MEKILLHICCAGCAGVCIERLQNDGFKVTGLFYNPNIHPEEEYIRRKHDLQTVAETYGIDIIEDVYDPAVWHQAVKGRESDPEGGERCGICFELRLRRVYEYAVDRGYKYFTTTLTVSPHKNSDCINTLGNSINGDRFLERNFKKRDGFVQSVRISEHLCLYRQNYCGCVHSMR